MSEEVMMALMQQQQQIAQIGGGNASGHIVVPTAIAMTAVDNNNNNNSSSDDSYLWSVHSTSEVVEMLYQMCFFAIGAPLNAIALRNFYKKRSKAHSGEIRLIRLSRQLLIAHLMVLCIYCLWRTHWIWNIHWTLGNTLCKAYSFLSALPFHLWSNMVAAIAIDMLYCIKVPLGSVPNGNRRVTWLILCAWMLAIVCAAPMTVFRGTRLIPNTPFVQCYHLHGFTNEQIMAFHFFHVITTFYVPLIVILFCYVSIGLSLRQQGANLRHTNCLANMNQHKRMQQNTKLRFLKATAAIVCTFVLSWLPYQVMALLRVVCEPDSKCEQMAANFNWLQSILLASTCINPFLYRFGIFRSRAGSAEGGGGGRRKGGPADGGSMAGCDSVAAPAIWLPTTSLIARTNGCFEPNSSIRSDRSLTATDRLKAKLSAASANNEWANPPYRQQRRDGSPLSLYGVSDKGVRKITEPNGRQQQKSHANLIRYNSSCCGDNNNGNANAIKGGIYQRLENGENVPPPMGTQKQQQ